MHVESIQVGVIRTHDAGNPGEEPWSSAIAKAPVEGAIWADVGGLNGDQVADRAHHGGPGRALLCYAAAHYPRWRQEWGRKDVGAGAFGENLTLTGLDEDRVCLGDHLAIGTARFAVTAPRTPCRTLERHLGRPGLIQTVLDNQRHGWYVRVLVPGWVEAGNPVQVVDRPYPQWTVARAAVVRRTGTPAERALLAACPALIDDWRRALRPPSERPATR